MLQLTNHCNQTMTEVMLLLLHPLDDFEGNTAYMPVNVV